MAVRRRRHKHGPGERKKHAEELSALLAPLEEQHPELAREAQGDGDGAYNDATIKVSSANVTLPKEFVEGERKGARIFRLDPVVLVILCLMLAFIAFIAWQISRMPPAAK
ncbi:MAG TPA: hypothetical protein VER32_08980 [Pyrinomonadaceae bacterium]|nr:hypothetical protein [Pyrinomonadaceae bacterium]